MAFHQDFLCGVLEPMCPIMSREEQPACPVCKGRKGRKHLFVHKLILGHVCFCTFFWYKHFLYKKINIQKRKYMKTHVHFFCTINYFVSTAKNECVPSCPEKSSQHAQCATSPHEIYIYIYSTYILATGVPSPSS